MNKANGSFKEISSLIDNFNLERGWKKYHNPKNLAISIVLEASELLEHFQWKDLKKSKDYANKINNKTELSNELADVCIYCFSLANELNIELDKAIINKLKINAEKYPIKR